MHSLMSDKIPVDSTVREVFGFSKANSPEEESCLLGLYLSFFLYLPKPHPRKRYRAGSRRIYWLRIHSSHEAQGYESGYLRWFEKNQHLCDQNYQNPNGSRAPAMNLRLEESTR